MIRLWPTDRFNARLLLNGKANDLVHLGLFKEISSIGLCEVPMDSLYSQLRVFMYSSGCRTEYSILTWRLNQYIQAELIVGEHGTAYLTATSGGKCYSICFTDKSLKRHWLTTSYKDNVCLIS